ncbi:hypothetical protein NPIL_569991 [Nephila pilipes]|uniref:Uncharacterized protein n=1 Tax=Nephila pilipes TaxID=299642 RepID=A0A8X6Q3U7_NEPPI|nr:hypothetical protein NPIL_569991 [Nephila pilipes]
MNHVGDVLRPSIAPDRDFRKFYVAFSPPRLHGFSHRIGWVSRRGVSTLERFLLVAVKLSCCDCSCVVLKVNLANYLADFSDSYI